MELLYAGFIAFVLILLALDLGVFHRDVHVVKTREALGWSAVWITLGLSFTAFIYFGYEHRWFGLGATHGDGSAAAIAYLTGFVVEKSLAVDNLFVIAMVFGYLKVPAIYQHRVLFWGIVGALVLRGAMIALGAVLIAEYGWVLYVFGGFLIVTGIKMLLVTSVAGDFERNLIVRATRRLVPVTERFHGARFFVRAGSPASHAPATPGVPAEPDRVVTAARRGALLVTPLFLALILVELTDVMFAVDSIPAIFAITADPFLVFTSNVFAILGMRSLYFALAGMIDRFKYLQASLAIVLVVIGLKMLAHGWLVAWLGPHFNFYMLGVIGLIIGTGVVASLVATRTRRDRIPGHLDPLDSHAAS